MGNLKVDSQICVTRDPAIRTRVSANPLKLVAKATMSRVARESERDRKNWKVGLASDRDCTLYRLSGKEGEYKIEGRVACTIRKKTRLRLERFGKTNTRTRSKTKTFSGSWVVAIFLEETNDARVSRGIVLGTLQYRTG